MFHEYLGEKTSPRRTTSKRRSRGGKMFSKMLSPGRAPPRPPPSLPPRISYPDSFYVGLQSVTSKQKGLSSAPRWGWGQRVLGRGRPLNKLKTGGKKGAGSASNSEFSWAFCLWLKNNGHVFLHCHVSKKSRQPLLPPQN